MFVQVGRCPRLGRMHNILIADRGVTRRDGSMGRGGHDTDKAPGEGDDQSPEHYEPVIVAVSAMAIRLTDYRATPHD